MNFEELIGLNKAHSMRLKVHQGANMNEFRYIAKIDSADSYLDYGQSERCVRLIAVDVKDFQEETFNLEDGCPTYLFDISWRVLMSKSARTPRWLLATYRMLEARPYDIWLEVRFQLSDLQSEGAYFYELFADAQPAYIHVHSVDFFRASTTVKAARQFVPSLSMNGAFDLWASPSFPDGLLSPLSLAQSRLG